ARTNEDNIALLDLHLLRFRRVLEIFQTDPVITREWILPFVFGDIEQDSTPNNRLDTRCVAVHCTTRAGWRSIVVHTIFPVNVGERVEMRAGMVMHEGKTGCTLASLGIELPWFRDAIISVTLVNNLHADTGWGDEGT